MLDAHGDDRYRDDTTRSACVEVAHLERTGSPSHSRAHSALPEEATVAPARRPRRVAREEREREVPSALFAAAVFFFFF